MWTRALSALLLVPLAACGGGGANNQASPFPAPHRPVAPVSSRYLNEDSRDRVGEFETVSRLAEVRERMFVADIGAGGGYYTVRLSPLVGAKGRVLAEDIVPQTIEASASASSASGSTMSRSSSASRTIRNCRPARSTASS